MRSVYHKGSKTQRNAKMTLKHYRRNKWSLGFLLWLAVTLTPSAVPAPANQAQDLLEGVESVGMTVADMDRSIEFFSKVLSFEKVADVEVWGSDYERLQGVFGLRMRVVRMRLGDEFIEVTEYLAPKGRPIPVDTRSYDRWFQHIAIIVNDMDRAYQWLRGHKVAHASTGPQTLPAWNKNAAGIKAFYFKDPDGHYLEILQFPPDKGLAKWHVGTDKLFLGIDHTAIVVAKANFVSPGAIQLAKETLDFKNGLLVRDPDGHAIQLVE